MIINNKISTKMINLFLSLVIAVSISFFSLPATTQAYTNPFSKSYFAYNLSSSTDMTNLGKDELNNGGLVVLIFGSPIISSGTYGVSNYSNGFKSDAAVATAVSNFISAYNSVSSHTQNIRVAVGITNFVNSNTPSDWTVAGQQWAQMVSGISPTGKVISIEGAFDIETSWQTSGPTTNFVNGFSNSTYNLHTSYLYDVGDNGGNYDKPGTTYSDSRNNGWTSSALYNVAYGNTLSYALPQIYYDASIPGYANMPNQWYHVAL